MLGMGMYDYADVRVDGHPELYIITSPEHVHIK